MIRATDMVRALACSECPKYVAEILNLLLREFMNIDQLPQECKGHANVHKIGTHILGSWLIFVNSLTIGGWAIRGGWIIVHDTVTISHMHSTEYPIPWGSCKILATKRHLEMYVRTWAAPVHKITVTACLIKVEVHVGFWSQQLYEGHSPFSYSHHLVGTLVLCDMSQI